MTTLHEWLYEIVCEICYDREYLYACYARHFTALMQEIFSEGTMAGAGRHEIPGIKSDLNAQLQWRLDHRLNMVGPNVLSVTCSLCKKATGAPVATREQTFELSSGEALMLPVTS